MAARVAAALLCDDVCVSGLFQNSGLMPAEANSFPTCLLVQASINAN